MKTQKRTCCAKRSVLEKILIVVVVLLLLLLVALFAVFVLHLQNDGRDNFVTFEAVPVGSSERHEAAAPVADSVLRQKRPTTCMTRQCVKAASQIIDFVDPSVHPCNDFYAFVCGNYLNRSSEANEITPLGKLKDATLSQLDSLITDRIAGDIPKSLELQRKYFKTCMDTEAVEYDNSSTLLTMIKKLGDWPVLHGRFWHENNFNWLKATIESRNLGVGYEFFLSFSVADVTNGTGPALLSINPPAVINIPYALREFYIDVMTNISIDLEAPAYLAKNEFIRVLDFEERLRSIVEDEGRNGQDALLKVSQLQAIFPQIKWTYFLNQITKASVPFTEETMVHIRVRQYLTNLLNLLANTPTSTQANYICWKIIENFRAYLKESVRARYESFLITVDPNYGVANNRYLFCLDNAKFYFPSVAELAYVRRYLQPYKRNSIKQMTAKIKNQLINIINGSKWLDQTSKSLAMDKVSSAQGHIGISDRAYNENFDKVVDMEDFDLHTDNIVEMTTQLYIKRTDKYFKIVNKHSKEIAQEALQKTPVLSINAFLAHSFNTLVVPAPFLQGLIYNFQRPQYMNYGALGTVIGHELVHSFISQQEIERWTSEAQQKYEEKVQCLLDDYKKYNGHLAEFTKNARSVLEENIADLVGPEVSYKAYQQFLRNYGQEQTLPSLEYTPNQIFWIMSGVFKCYQPKLNQNFRFDENHGVPSFAVISSVRNSPDFAADFNCPAGSNMNPYQKCQIF